MLAQLALHVDLHAFRLLLKERLQHGEELSALRAREVSLLRILRDHLRALRQHLGEALLTMQKI